MSVRVSDHVLRRLRAWGVEHVFGYPGSGLRGLLAAWGRAGDEPRFVQARHEETSALQAVGYAKFSGRLGVCAASSGPGAVHLLNGLYDAKLDRVPVLAIVGTTDPVTDGTTDGTSAGSADATADATAMSGTHRRQVDLDTLFADVASEFMATVTTPTSCGASWTGRSARRTPAAARSWSSSRRTSRISCPRPPRTSSRRRPTRTTATRRPFRRRSAGRPVDRSVGRVPAARRGDPQLR